MCESVHTITNKLKKNYLYYSVCVNNVFKGMTAFCIYIIQINFLLFSFTLMTTFKLVYPSPPPPPFLGEVGV